MSNSKHTEDTMGLLIVAAMPVFMIAMWFVSLLFGSQI